MATEIPCPNLKSVGSLYWNFSGNTEDQPTFLIHVRSVPLAAPESCRNIAPPLDATLRNPKMEEPIKINGEGGHSGATLTCAQSEEKAGRKRNSATTKESYENVNLANSGHTKKEPLKKSNTKGLSCDSLLIVFIECLLGRKMSEWKETGLKSVKDTFWTSCRTQGFKVMNFNGENIGEIDEGYKRGSA
ncbi:uncharacterized protein LOC127254739 [Andrographis paniculata]|uniref:uncharacterized protein LOC127254739 n=1 Tax=Andrographis paniculata TaxID=175694 RepID=UPI0021E73D77|nr:uncharacterized protein LOC127254739 [Andrographis paniculata]